MIMSNYMQVAVFTPNDWLHSLMPVRIMQKLRTLILKRPLVVEGEVIKCAKKIMKGDNSKL